MKYWNWLTTLAVIALAPLVALAEVESVSGTVRNDQGQPVSGSKVRIVNISRVDKAEATTGSQGDYSVDVKGKGWSNAAKYRMEVTSADGQLSVSRNITLADGPNVGKDSRLSTRAPAAAAGAAISAYPMDNPGWYAGVVGGMQKINRNQIRYGRTDAEAGRLNIDVDPDDEWVPAAGAIIGYQLNKKQALELNYLGSFSEINDNTRAAAINVGPIDPAFLGVWTPTTGNVLIKQEYESDWHDAALMYRHRLLDRETWNIVGKAGIFGGFVGTDFKSRITTDGIPTDNLDEEVEDKYVGPQIGAEAQFRFCERFWAGVGLNVGGAFGTADLTAKERLFNAPFGGFDDARVKDDVDYISLRAGGTVSVGWSPCDWASLILGYRFEWWSNNPAIDNPGAAIGNSSTLPDLARRAHLITDDMTTQTVTGSVVIKFR